MVYQVCVWYARYVYGMYGMGIVWYGYTSRHGTWQGLGKRVSTAMDALESPFNMASYLT